mgnify:CR=1 FL=1
MEIKKSPKADLERGKSLSILMGFVVGLAVLFVGFEWSTRDVMVVQASEGVADIIAEEEVRVLRDYRPRIRIKLRKALVICFHGFDSFFKIRLVVHVEDGFFRPIFIF